MTEEVHAIVEQKLRLSKLPKTWILDLDGTLVKHNGYLEGGDQLLPGVREFFENLAPDDFVIVLTSRQESYREETERFLRENGIRYNAIIFGLPYGERILVNDRKPSGLTTAYAVNKERDEPLTINYVIDEEL